MIDIALEVKKAKLRAVEDRITEFYIVQDIAKGVWFPKEGELLPEPESDSRIDAWNRAIQQVQSLGPSIMETKVNAVTGGGTTWGETDESTDAILAKLNLPELAEACLASGATGGFYGVIPHEIEMQNADGQLVGSGEFTISLIGGYVEAFTDPNNAGRIVGLYQAWIEEITTQGMSVSQRPDTATRPNSTAQKYDNNTKYSVRIYDWSDGEDNCVIREWRGLKKPTDLATQPREILNAPMPRFRITSMTDGGLPLGEILKSSPLLKSHLTTQIEIQLTEEMAAFPMLVTTGDATISAVGPAQSISLPPDGDAKWLSPEKNLEELRTQLAAKQERIRHDLSLPGGFLGNDSPSGEALKEANLRFRQNTQRYAEGISEVLTEAVKDLSTMVAGLQPVEAAVLPSKDYDEAERRATIIELYKEGLLPFEVAVTELQPFFPTWSDQRLQDFVAKRQTTVSATDALNALNG